MKGAYLEYSPSPSRRPNWYRSPTVRPPPVAVAVTAPVLCRLVLSCSMARVFLFLVSGRNAAQISILSYFYVSGKNRATRTQKFLACA